MEYAPTVKMEDGTYVAEVSQVNHLYIPYVLWKKPYSGTLKKLHYGTQWWNSPHL